MKRILLSISLLLSQFLSFAQISNGGFEVLNPSELPTYWVPKFYVFPVLMDSLGLPTSDSIVFDGFMNAINKQTVHSGNNAYEMRSGFNYTKNKGFSSAVRAMGDSATMGFFAGGFPYSQSMNKLQFFYRFQSIAGDTAMASMVIYDENEEELYRFDMDLTVHENSFREMNQTIAYSSSKPAAYATLVFSTCKPESEPHLGSRLIIDDISLSSANGINEANIGGIRFYPNPVKNKLFIESNDLEFLEDIHVFDTQGKEMMHGFKGNEINLNDLNPGLYFIQFNYPKGSILKKIIKE